MSRFLNMRLVDPRRKRRGSLSLSCQSYPLFFLSRRSISVIDHETAHASQQVMLNFTWMQRMDHGGRRGM